MTGSPLFKQFESGDSVFSKILRFLVLASGTFLLCFTGILELTWPQQIVLGILTIALVIWLDRSSSSYLVTLTLLLASMFLDLPLWVLENRHHHQILLRPRLRLEPARRILHLASDLCRDLRLHHPLPRLPADNVAAAPHSRSSARRSRRVARRRSPHPHL